MSSLKNWLALIFFNLSRKLYSPAVNRRYTLSERLAKYKAAEGGWLQAGELPNGELIFSFHEKHQG